MLKDAPHGASRMQAALESGPVPRDGPIAARGNGDEGIVLCILLLAQGILRCLCSETTMCFVFPRTLDQAIAGSRNQHWRGITQRAGNGSHRRRASISCPPFLRGNWVVRGSLPAPSKWYGVVRKVVVCCCMGVLPDLYSAGVLVSAGVVF